MPPNGEQPNIDQRLAALMSAIEASRAEFKASSADFFAGIQALKQRQDTHAMHLELAILDGQQTMAEIKATTANVDKLAARMDQLTRVVQTAAETVNRLANAVEAHEERLDDLEGPPKQ